MNQDLFKRVKSYKIKLWLQIIRDNVILSVFNLIIYFFPLIVIQPDINIVVINNFNYAIIFLFIVFCINEFFKLNKIVEVNQDKRFLIEKKDQLEAYSDNVSSFLEELPKDLLKNVSKFLGLKNSDRISLYVVDEEGFHIIGRYSENPYYNEHGRMKYPIDKGYISKCLKNNNGKPYFSREHLPEDKAVYRNVVSSETNMRKNDIKNLSMQSRSYFTRVIKDNSDKNVGVLVIESMNAELPIKEQELDKRLQELSIPHMTMYLDISSKLKENGLNE